MFAPNRRFSVNGSMVRSTAVPTSRRSVVKSTAQSDRKAELSNFLQGSLFGNAGNTNMNVSASGPMGSVTLLAGLVPQSEDQLRKFYRDIYYYDAVAGSAVDLFANFPFSEFTLTGAKESRLQKYHESMKRLNVRSLMPEIATAYLVDGTFVSSLIFNKKDKVFIDLLMYPVDDCNIDRVPLYSTDPTIVVRNNEELRKFMASQDRQATALKALLDENLKRALRSAAFKLDPLTSLHVARRTIPGTEPISWLKRILPAYLVEKALYRGTLVEVNKRMRSMLHVAMGDDTHEFTPEEMAETVNQFQMADLDPLGAVIGTRNNVQVSEVRQGGDFWKWTDNIDVLTPFKLRALGISEAFLSGDSNYSNTETALSVFMENADAFRSFLTYEVFTNKIFPIVAIENDFFKEGKEVNTENRKAMTYQANNATDLEIPTVRWHKRLEAKSEENMMELLDALGEKGIPIPLRMYAAAAKVDLESLFHDLQQDKSIRDRIKKLTGVDVPAGSTTGDEDGGEFARVLSRLQQQGLMNRNVGTQRIPLLARHFPEGSGEIKSKTKTGKDKYIVNQRAAQAKVHGLIARATKALNDPNVKAAALKRVSASLGTIPNILAVPEPEGVMRRGRF